MGKGRPDWYTSMRIEGKYGTDYVPVAVDENGNIVVLVKGDYLGALKTIAVDEDGMLQTNITRQGLEWLTVRPVYGEIRLLAAGAINCPTGLETQLWSISGKGATYEGWAFLESSVSCANLYFNLYIDGGAVITDSLGDLELLGAFKDLGFLLSLWRYDDVNFKYKISVGRGITFEESIALTVHHSLGVTLSINSGLHYALIPS